MASPGSNDPRKVIPLRISVAKDGTTRVEVKAHGEVFVDDIPVNTRLQSIAALQDGVGLLTLLFGFVTILYGITRWLSGRWYGSTTPESVYANLRNIG